MTTDAATGATAAAPAHVSAATAAGDPAAPTGREPAVPGREPAAPGVVPAALLGGRRPTVPLLGFTLVTAVALAVALRLPAAVTVLGLVCFGILHNVLEIRYVAGRFDRVLSGPLLRLLAVLITGIVVCRLLPPGPWPRTAEILLVYGILLTACVFALRRSPAALAASFAVLALAASASTAFPSYHFVVLTHLHNLVPLLFLWEWSAGLRRGRALFRAVQAGWVLVVPALVLAGVFDHWLAAGPADLGAFGTHATGRLSAAYTPPLWLDSAMALRFLAVFAFLQTMHYAVWVWFLPRYAPGATAGFERRLPALRGRRTWALGALGGLALAIVFASDHASGRTLYSALASYHAYVEFPVLLALLLGIGTAAAGTAVTTASARPGR